jgi:putative flippase GtrA
VHVVLESWRRILTSWRRLLPEKWHAITEEFAKFGTIGIVNLFVNFAVFNLLWLTVLRTGEVKAKAIATMVAITCAYFMNRHWTYRDRPKSTLRREYSLFFFFNLVGLIIEVAVMFIAKYGFHQTHILVLNLCTGLGIVLGTAFRFWAYRTHVFKIEEAPVPAAEADESGTFAITAEPVAHERVNGSTPAKPASTPVQVTERVNGSAPIQANGSHQARPADVDEVEIELDGMVALAEEPAKPHR